MRNLLLVHNESYFLPEYEFIELFSPSPTVVCASVVSDSPEESPFAQRNSAILPSRHFEVNGKRTIKCRRQSSADSCCIIDAQPSD